MNAVCKKPLSLFTAAKTNTLTKLFHTTLNEKRARKDLFKSNPFGIFTSEKNKSGHKGFHIFVLCWWQICLRCQRDLT